MWARRNLAIAGVLAAMLLMGPGSMRVQGLKLRANRAGLEPVGLAALGRDGARMAGAGDWETARIARNAGDGEVLCLIARGRGADAENLVRRALGGAGLALDAHLAEGMADGIQAAARVDASGARLYLADPYIPMDY